MEWFLVKLLKESVSRPIDDPVKVRTRYLS